MAEPRSYETTTLDDDAVWKELNRVARSALRQADATGGDGSRGPHEAVRARMRQLAEDGTGSFYDVRAQTLLHGEGAREVVVVAIERKPTAPGSSAPVRKPAVSTDSLEERFGLSPRQAEVALLVAQRMTTKEIAARLNISRHTARRHVEAVLLRMKVHKRTSVQRVIERVAARRTGPVVHYDRAEGF